MAIKIIGVILLFSLGRALSQYDATYLASSTPDSAYDKTHQEIINNFLSNKPLLNYVPVYNTDYGHWDGGNRKVEDPIKKSQPEYQLPKPTTTYSDVDFQRLGQIVTRLKSDMQTLSHKTKHVYENRLRELNEVKKLNDNLRVALQNTDMLKNNLQQNEKQLIEMAKNPQNPNGYPVVNPAGVEQFLKTIESLESMVRNINYKFEGKLGM